jgi:hypothetical protein
MSKTIIILLIVLIFIAFIILYFKSLNAPQPKISGTGNYSIKQVIPDEQSKNVAIYLPIQITFSRPLSDQEQAEVNVTLDPEVNSTTEWLQEGSILQVTPQSPFLTDTIYTTNVNMAGKKYNWQFTTIMAEEAAPEDQIKAQEKADRNFGEWAEDFDKTYPWHTKFPLDTPDYFVAFDPDKKEFLADIYPKNSSSTPIATQEENLKKEITDKLTSLGIDLTQFSIVWASKPE